MTFPSTPTLEPTLTAQEGTAPNPPAPGAGFMAAGFRPTPSFPPPQGSSVPPPPTPTVFTMPENAQKKTAVGKNIILAGVMVLILAGLVLGFDKARSFLSQAEGSCDPENLAETNLTPNSVEITFQTGKACLTAVSYGTSSESMLLQVPEAMASLNHRIRLAPLLPSTTYYYQVSAEGKKVGTVRSFLTKISQTPTEPPVMAPTETPAVVPTQATSSGKFTSEDFKAEFGGSNTTFDIDKNGVVNARDWVLYQETVK